MRTTTIATLTGFALVGCSSAEPPTRAHTYEECLAKSYGDAPPCFVIDDGVLIERRDPTTPAVSAMPDRHEVLRRIAAAVLTPTELLAAHAGGRDPEPERSHRGILTTYQGSYQNAAERGLS